jgi:polysaccharide lyase family 8-like protein
VSYSDNIISKPVFSVWIDLGKKVVNESYSNIIVPNVSAMDAIHYANPIKILSNDTAVQAVHHSLLGLTAATFYQPDSFNIGNGWKLSVNLPVMLMFRETADGVNISVSSPENKALVVEVTLNQRLICDECTWWPQKGVIIVSVELPGGFNAGKSVTKSIKRKKR